MDTIYKIYKVTNKQNNKVYIGVTEQGVDARLKGHFCKAKSGSNYAFHKAIREYGENAFMIETIDVTIDVKLAPELEKKYIKLFHSNEEQFGYNSTTGGEYVVITEAMRLAMSNGQRGCEKLRLRKGVIQYSHDGKFIKEFRGITEASKETGVSRAAILRVLKKEIKRGSKSNPYIWVLSDEYEEIPLEIDPSTVYKDLNFKSSISTTCEIARKQYETKDGDLLKLSKPVCKYDVAMNFIEEYPSIAEAARKNNMSCEAIRMHLRGMYDYTDTKVLSRLKFIWKYKE